MINDIDILKSFIKNDNIYYDENHNIIVDGDIYIFPDEDIIYNEFPVKIYKVNGNIHWYGSISTFNGTGTLKSLNNFPDIVTGDVLIFKNTHLLNLTGCPIHIGGTLQCDYCNIKDITGIAQYIGKNCILNNNPITDISPLYNSIVKGEISIINTPVAYNTEQVSKLQDTSLVRIYKNNGIEF